MIAGPPPPVSVWTVAMILGGTVVWFLFLL